jgi:hypothetical protein
MSGDSAIVECGEVYEVSFYFVRLVGIFAIALGEGQVQAGHVENSR